MRPDIVYDYNPFHLPRALLEAIGIAMTSAAQTEGIVEAAIAGCLGVDAVYGVALTTHMNMPLRFSVLRSVAEIRIDDLDALDQLDILIANIEQAFIKRNDIAHRNWCRNPDTGEIFTVKTSARSGITSELIPMSLEQVKDDALFIYTSGIELMGFLKTHDLYPSLPTLKPLGHKTKAARKARRGKLGET